MNYDLKGKRVRIIEMIDDYAVPEGTEGTILHTDDAGTIHVHWDNGRMLGIIPEIDKYEILD
jgi:hypothetical protein